MNVTTQQILIHRSEASKSRIMEFKPPKLQLVRIPLQNAIILHRTPHPDGGMMVIRIFFCFPTFLLACTFIPCHFSVHGSPGKCFFKVFENRWFPRFPSKSDQFQSFWRREARISLTTLRSQLICGECIHKKTKCANIGFSQMLMVIDDPRHVSD